MVTRWLLLGIGFAFIGIALVLAPGLVTYVEELHQRVILESAHHPSYAFGYGAQANYYLVYVYDDVANVEPWRPLTSERYYTTRPVFYNVVHCGVAGTMDVTTAQRHVLGFWLTPWITSVQKCLRPNT